MIFGNVVKFVFLLVFLVFKFYCYFLLSVVVMLKCYGGGMKFYRDFKVRLFVVFDFLKDYFMFMWICVVGWCSNCLL